jgi:hypothetical protein
MEKEAKEAAKDVPGRGRGVAVVRVGAMTVAAAAAATAAREVLHREWLLAAGVEEREAATVMVLHDAGVVCAGVMAIMSHGTAAGCDGENRAVNAVETIGMIPGQGAGAALHRVLEGCQGRARRSARLRLHLMMPVQMQKKLGTRPTVRR